MRSSAAGSSRRSHWSEPPAVSCDGWPAVWEAGLVGTAALVVGGLVTTVLGWMLRHAIAHDVDGAALTIPWTAMISIMVTALGLVLAAGFTGSMVNGRRQARA